PCPGRDAVIRCSTDDDGRKRCGPSWRATRGIPTPLARLPSPPKQLLWCHPVPPRDFGNNGAWLLALQHDARIGFRRPPASSADTCDHFDALQTFRTALSALKRMVVRTRSMLVHGHALCPCRTHAGRWERITAYVRQSEVSNRASRLP